MERKPSSLPKRHHVIIGTLVFIGLFLSSRYSYLLFHSFAELFSVSVAGTVFMVSWHTRRDSESGYFLFLGIGSLFFAFIDLLHLLSYKGMGVFPGYGANLPTQLWIAMRYLMAFTFLAAPAFIGKRLNHRLVLASFASVAAFLVASIFSWGIFPDCFVEGSGLTPFKIISEYVISGVFLASIAFLAKKKGRIDPEVLQLLVASIVAATGTELLLTLYTDVYGLTNLAGHYLEILSFYLIYRAVVATDLVRKHELGIRLRQELEDRKFAEKMLLDTKQELEIRQAELAALLEGARSVLAQRGFEDTARSIFLSCKELVGAAAGYVALLSKDGTENEIAFLDSGGLSCTVDPSLPMPIRGLRGEAFRAGTTVFDNDFSRSEWTRFLPEGHAHLENVMFAPLLIEKKVVGLIGLANKPGGFTEGDSRMASAFGELAAIALLNARMLESLEESEERFRSVAQTANDAIVTVDGNGAIALWNEGAEKMFGYAADEITGRPLSTIIPPRLREAHEHGMGRAAADGESHIFGKTLEMTGLHKGGGEFPVELSVASWKAGEKVFFTGIMRDITDRKRVEEHIRHLASFPELNPNPVLEMDYSGKVVYFNPATEKTLKKLGMEIGDAAVFLPPGLDVITSGQDGIGETVIHHEVTVKDMTFAGNVSLFPASRIARLYMRDITSRKKAEVELKAAKEALETRVAERTAELSVLADRLRAELEYRLKTEEALRESMALLENIFSNIHLCVVYLDPEFNFIRVNKAYADGCGYPPEFFPGKNHFDLYPHAENEAIFRKVVETGVPFNVVAKPFEFPDHPEWGVTYWDWSLLPITDPAGKVSALIFCLVDVTERKRAEADLERSEELFRSLVTESPVGIFILRNGRIGYMNPEQERLFGGIPENYALREFPDIHPEDRKMFEEFCNAVLSGERKPPTLDLRFYPFGGSTEYADMRWVHCRATPIGAYGDVAFLTIMVDITRLKEMERQFVIREKLASLGHVAAGIAHEIRSPLSGINIYLSALGKILLEADCIETQAREEAGEVVLQIQSASHRIESVIRKIMDFVRPSSPRKEQVDLSVAVESAVDFTALTLRKSGIVLDRTAIVPLPKCPADPDLIAQVVMNLIANAAQAMENAASKIIEVSTIPEDGRIVIRVADSGPGVPQEIRDRIFDPFYTTRKDGYGIGLSFCRRVIEDHGGALQVGRSRLGGAEFRIEIPVEPRNAQV
ncbi:MAG: PAS domain S-box protein [Deltaproteobacteria bacterium]|nr:PAS domain S-box protein [Deltaproteobacteria bacterium]